MKEIPLTQGKVALVDDEDYEVLSKVKWYAMKYMGLYYAVRTSTRATGKQSIYMHRVILSPVKGEEIDHINGNGLDNRRENLRIVTHRENQQNLHIKKTSKYPGVSWNTHAKKWKAEIHVSGKGIYLGLFDEEIDAAKAYTNACVDLL